MDARILELLSSRICHDLVSPVGAVNNGVEFLEEMGPDALDDALGLIKYSSAQASAKLQAFRIAYGAGGADPDIKPENIQKIFSAFIGGEGKVTQSWEPYAPLGQDGNPPGFCKLLMATLMLAEECLPKGGTITVRPGEPGQTVVTAEGQGAALRDGVEDALHGTADIDTLPPKLVHPLITGQISERYGFSISISGDTSGRVVIQITASGNGSDT